MEQIFILAKMNKIDDLGPLIQFLMFFGLLWSFIIMSFMKAKLFWGGIVVGVAGVFYPSVQKPQSKKHEINVSAKSKGLEHKQRIAFKGTLRGALVIGGILISLYSIYHDGPTVWHEAKAHRDGETQVPPMPSSTPVNLD